MSNDNTQDGAEPSPASAGSHGDQCRCGLATRLVGDGCEHCNPAMMIDILREQVAEMRLTDAEREAIERAMNTVKMFHGYDRKITKSLRGLLQRNGAVGGREAVQ